MKVDLKKRRAFKFFLFQEGRLLERKIYSVIFENEPESKIPILNYPGGDQYLPWMHFYY